MGCKVQTFDAVWVARDDELVAGQGLPADDFAQVVGKMFERREAAGLGVEMQKSKLQPPCWRPPCLRTSR